MSKVPPEARKGADWMPDESSKCCVRCKKEFTLFTRRHHCYFDGRLLCDDCTPSKCVIPAQIGGTSKNEVRVCADCKDWIDQAASGKGIVLRGELLKAYEDFVLGLRSLSKTEIEKLETVTALPDHFISGKKDARFKKITSINLKLFVSVQHVGNCLLEDCEQLCFDKEVLAPLLRASNIEDEWLRQVASGKFVLAGELLKAYEAFVLGGSSLSSLELSKLKLVTALPDDFLNNEDEYGEGVGYECVTSLDLSMFVAVREIGHSFIRYCSGLRSVDLKGLSNVTSVGGCFLFGCSSLQSIDLKPLSNVTSVDSNFLSDCRGVQSIDLKGLSNVTSVDSHFLSGCSGLQSIDLKGLSNVTSVASSFLYGCSGLQSVDLKPLSNVTSVDSFFLSGCSSLQSIDLKPLSNVTSVSSCFLYGCSGLQSIDLKGLSNVTSVDSHFLSDCPKLTKKEYLDQVDLTPLLHIPDGNIEIGKREDKEKNLKKALQRVRAGGANGPKFVAHSSSATAAASSNSNSNSSGVASAPKKHEGLENASPSSSQVPSQNEEEEEEEENNKNNSSGVKPAPERKNHSSSGVAPPPAKREQEEGELTENRQGRFDFNQEFETDQFDVAFDLPVFSPSYTPVHSARDAYAKVIGAIIGSKEKTQMTFTEVDKMLALVQTKTDALLQTVGKQHGQSQDEVFAIVAYSADVSRVNRALEAEHNFYYLLNNALGMRASADFSNHSPLLDLFCHFITGLRKIPAEKNITVYRAVSKSLSELSKKGAYEKVGTSICWPALTSTSLDPKVSLGFVTKAQKCAALMKIKVSSAYPIIEYSQFPYEKELLLLPNSVVKIDAVRSAVPRTDSEITSLSFKGALPNTIDVVEMSQQERSSSEMSNFPSSPTRPTQEKPIQKMDEDELCAFLKTRGTPPKILSILKEEGVVGGEFFEKDFVVKNQSVFSTVRETAFEFFKKLHAELSGGGVTSASAASH